MAHLRLPFYRRTKSKGRKFYGELPMRRFSISELVVAVLGGMGLGLTAVVLLALYSECTCHLDTMVGESQINTSLWAIGGAHLAWMLTAITTAVIRHFH